MQNSNILVLKHNNKDLRVIVDRQEPWFIVDDLVALADIEDKQSAMEHALENESEWGPLAFDKIFMAGEDGKVLLHDITDFNGARTMAVLSGGFGMLDHKECNGCTLLVDAFEDWFFGSATEQITAHWNQRVKDYEMMRKLEEKDQEVASLTQKLQQISSMVQQSAAAGGQPKATQVH